VGVSGSPKKTQMSLRAQQQDRLREEEARRRAAAAEARARRERVVRRQAIAALRAEGEESLARLRAAIAAGRDGPVREAEEALRTLGPRLDLAQDVGALRRIVTGLDEARAAFEGAATRREAEAELAAAPDRRRFDPEGAARVDALLRDGAVPARVRAAVDAHLRAAGAARLEARVHAETACADAEARLAGLRDDVVFVAWAGAELDRLEREVGAARGLLAAGDPTAAEARIAAAVIVADSAEERAAARQFEERKRAYIVQGLLNVLQRQGFQVGAPALARPGDYDADVVIRASREGGRRRLDVEVPVEGPVRYDVDGWAKRVEAGRDGRPVASCDEAEARLRAIHDMLASEFEIDAGELTWDDRDPLRLRKDERELPGEGALVRERERG
jgi:hypothetical protein